MRVQRKVRSQAGGNVLRFKKTGKPVRILSDSFCILLMPILLVWCECSRSPVDSNALNTFRKLQTDFLSPPDQFRFISHWVWNGPVTENEIHFQIREFSDKGIGTLIISAADGTSQQLSAAKMTADSLGILVYTDSDSVLRFDPGISGMDLWTTEPYALACGSIALKLAADRTRQAGERWVLMDMGQIQSDLSFHSLIRGINQAAAYGANRFVIESRFHLLDDSVRNNLSFSYHLPWWDLFTPLSDYFARLIMALSFGEPVRPVLVVLPERYEGLNEVQPSACLLLKRLDATVEYDLIRQDQLKKAGVRRNTLVIGAAEYQQLILMPGTDLQQESRSLIDAFMKSAGPEKVLNGSLFFPDSDTSSDQKQTVSEFETRLVDTLATLNREWVQTFQIRVHGDQQGLCHQRRQLHDGQLIYLFNSADEPIHGDLTCEGQALYNLDCLKGRISRIACSKTEDGIQVSFDLKSGENLLYFAAAQDSFEVSGSEELSQVHEIIPPESDPRVMPVYYNSWNLMQAEPSDPSILVKPGQFSFKWPRHMDAASLMVVADCRGKELTVNNVPVDPIPDAWLLDRAFSVYSIGDAVRSGNNHIQILSCGQSNGLIGIFGDFLLRRSGKEFKIRPPHPLPLHGWKAEMPFYSDAVSTIQTYEIHRESGKYLIRLGKWSGIVAEVLVNESPAGLVIGDEETDVTGLLRDGWNDISVVVYGSLNHFFREINKARGKPPRNFGLEEPFQCVHVPVHSAN
jgi:hypothetical protein